MYSALRLRHPAWLAVAAVSLVACLPGCGQALEVDVLQPRTGSIEESFREPARTRLAKVHTITLPIDGRIGRVDLDPGDAVTAGQELVSFDRVPFLLSEHACVSLDEEIAGADRDVVGLLECAVGQRQPGLRIGDVALERVKVAELSGDAQSFERSGWVVARTLDTCSGGQSELSFGDAVLQGVDVPLGLERLGEVGDPHDYRPTTPSRLTSVSSIWSMVDTTRAAAS